MVREWPSGCYNFRLYQKEHRKSSRGSMDHLMCHAVGWIPRVVKEALADRADRLGAARVVCWQRRRYRHVPGPFRLNMNSAFCPNDLLNLCLHSVREGSLSREPGLAQAQRARWLTTMWSSVASAPKPVLSVQGQCFPSITQRTHQGRWLQPS